MGVHYSRGTVRKFQKPSGKWEWQGLILATIDGKKKQLTKMTGIECEPGKKPGRGHVEPPSGPGAKRALKFVNDWRDDLIANTPTPMGPYSELSVAEFMQKYYNSLDLTPSTRCGYEALVKYIDILDCNRITDLTPQMIEEWKLELARRGVGKHTANKAFNSLKYACNWGVGVEGISKNPCTFVKAPPRPRTLPNPLDPSQVPNLKAALHTMLDTKPEFSNMALMALNTGMRRGELCGLSWTDVDGYRDGAFEGYVHVNRVVAAGSTGTYMKDYPKNGNRRMIDINEEIATILRRRRDCMLEHVDELSGCYVFAFPSCPERYPSPDYVSRTWGIFASMNGFKGVEGRRLRFHDLRGTFATTALVNDIPVVTVASILGHENPTTTHKHYSHFIPSKNKAAMDYIGTLLGA